MTEPQLGPVEPFLEEMWRTAATDLLLTAGAPPLMRVDGRLTPVADGHARLTGDDTERIVGTLLGTELTERLRRDLEVDTSFGWGDRARLRANAFHQRGSLAMALRIIPFRIPGFDELGLPDVCREIVKLPQGLVLVTGPTGSGKSTTLASMIDAINQQRACHIVTIEDPIEYVYEHKRSAIEQREVGIDTHSFARALRSAFREDPDVLLVGEMRDTETIAATLTLAETGHLVFATLHTNDAAQTVDRVVDVFPAAQQGQIRVQLAASLQAIVSQRLIPQVDRGMVAAFEVLIASHAARNIVREGRTNQLRNLIITGAEFGMQTLEASLSQLVAEGLVSHEEAVAHSLFPAEITRPRPVAEHA
jgi:twitching motility protein PilT